MSKLNKDAGLIVMCQMQKSEHVQLIRLMNTPLTGPINCRFKNMAKLTATDMVA